MKGAFVIVAVLLFVLGSDAVFDREFRELLLRPGGLSIQDIVTCSRDDGRRFDVPLVPVVENDGSVLWRPQTPDYITLPDALDCANRDRGLVDFVLPELQGIDMGIQRLSATGLDLTGPLPAEMRDGIAAVCSRVYDDRTDIDNFNVIVGDTLIRVTNESSVMGFFFSTDQLGGSPDQRNQMEDLFDALRCRVNYRFVDLGPAFLPRYMLAGGCITRSCSVPIDLGQTCRPDLSAIGRLPGLRYDCCWDYDEEDKEHKFDCGWRRVMLPILCDCDCACASRE